MSQHEIGPATTTPPQHHPDHDPGDIYAYGPAIYDRDSLTPAQRVTRVEQKLTRLLGVLARREQEGFRAYGSGQTDGSGNVTITLATAAPNQKFNLHRVAIQAGTYTWIAPYVGAGMVQILTGPQGSNLATSGVTEWDGGGLNTGQTPGQLPCAFTSGRLTGIEAQDGESLFVRITGGPANTQITVNALLVRSTVYQDDDA